jgi:hypothetical protein
MRLVFALVFALAGASICMASASMGPGNDTVASKQNFPGYISFPGYSFAHTAPFAYFGIMAPVPNMPPGYAAYASTRALQNPSVLKAVCDAYDDGCQWFNTDNAIGYFLYNSSVASFIKNTSGSVEDNYFRLNSNVFCNPYVGWDLPVNLVIEQCDQDVSCAGVIAQSTNAHSDLCRFDDYGARDAYIRLGIWHE